MQDLGASAEVPAGGTSGAGSGAGSAGSEGAGVGAGAGAAGVGSVGCPPHAIAESTVTRTGKALGFMRRNMPEATGAPRALNASTPRAVRRRDGRDTPV